MDFNVAEPTNQGGANTSPDPLNSLQGVVNAAKEVAAAQTTTPQDQFSAQFGSGATPVIENPNPTAGVTLQPEDPQETFVQDIKAAVEKLEQATREKVAA